MASTYTPVTTGAIVLEVLNKHNYKEWSARVKTYLLSKDLWDVVEAPEAENGLAENKARRIKNAKALHAIKISCGTEMFSVVKEITSAKKAWERLEKKCRDTGTGGSGLHRAAMGGQVQKVIELLPSIREEELKMKDDTRGSDLHRFAMKGQVQKVIELLSSIREEELKMKDGYDRTALDVVIVEASREAHWIQIAKAMVEKNPEIVNITSKPNLYIPVVRAASLNKWEMARCLFSLTPDPEETFLSKKGKQGAELISKCIWRPEGLDVAWKLLQQYPSLAMAKNGLQQQPMLELAGIRTAYPSRERLTFWQKLIYKSIRIRHVEFCYSCIPESRITVESEDEPSRADQGLLRSLFCSVRNVLREAVSGASQRFGIKSVYEMKLNHLRFEKFLSFMVQKIKDLKPTEAELGASLFKAIEHGHVEFVKKMFEANPAVVDFKDDKKRRVFQRAIECRQEKVYNLIYELDPEKRAAITRIVANFKTNLLHSAAHISSAKHPKHVQDASLQMQRELQWFKEVESKLPSEMHEYVNISNLTARELFDKNHKKLKDEAEVSTKGVAASCTTVGALIITMMFAAAFTAPGGTNGDTGLPLFLHRKLFRIYIISDTISLVSSAASVITFLGLLTSTYAEDDFLWSLPTKMTIGLSSLFISIATMMITFACALTIMFHGDATMITTSIVLATVPVVSFAFFLFPLLYQICRWTYGPSMFGKKA